MVFAGGQGWVMAVEINVLEALRNCLSQGEQRQGGPNECGWEDICRIKWALKTCRDHGPPDSVGSVSHTQEKLESVDTWPCCLTIFSKVPLQLLF